MITQIFKIRFHRFIYLTLISFLLSSLMVKVNDGLFAQDTAQKNFPVTFFLTENSFSQGKYSAVDSSLDTYHYYVPGFFQNFKTLGNIGSPVQCMFYSNPQITGFNSGINFMDAYISKKENIKYYNTRRPYSKIFFVTGSKEEQVLKMQLTENIGRQFNFGLNYDNIISTGFYQRQKTKLNDFNFHCNYETKNKRYGNFANFIYDRMDVQENGGLFEDSQFEENISERKESMDVNLQDAANTYKKKSYYIKHYLNFGNKEEYFDAKDSVNRKIISPLFRISHTFSFEKNIYSYKDAQPDSSYYLPVFNYNRARIPIDTVKDSINIKVYENTLGLSTVDFTDFTEKHYGFKNFYANVFAKYQNVSRLTHNDNFDSSFQNLMAGVDLNFRFLKLFSAGGNAVQILNGFNKNDHFYNGFLEFNPDSSAHHVRFSTYHQIKHPDWIYTHYFSDQFGWRNDFANSSYSGQTISYSNEKWKINAGFSQSFISNLIYLDFKNFFPADTVIRLFPQQKEKGRIGIYQIFLNKKFQLWKFHLNTNIYLQETNDEVYFPLPDFTTHNSFYYENFMLRKSIYGQIGVDFYYMSEYYANAYSPLLKTTYLQYNKLTGGYPFFDFFFNFRIKSVRAFFKITHINYGFSGNNYSLVPHYPQPDRAFHFGVDWKFLD